ncbi:MAG: hypothetical protein H7274_04155 [Rhodoferax sp.]|nr:hypothetical protein [Rhodoferax sp.]
MHVFWKSVSLKKVGSSGQIAVGKKFAGRILEIVVDSGDRFEPIPMKAAPQAASVDPRNVKVVDGWLPPEVIRSAQRLQQRT